MPHRFELLERIAFSMLVCSAVACSTFIAYEKSPDFRDAAHTVARMSAETPPLGCTPSDNTYCLQYTLE